MHPLARLALLTLTFSPISMILAQPLTTNPTITVQAGDTLEAISRKQGISLAALMKLNPTVIAERLAIGTILKLPAALINQAQVFPPELSSGAASAAL